MLNFDLQISSFNIIMSTYMWKLLTRFISLFLISGLLISCGGGSDSPATTTPPPVNTGPPPVTVVKPTPAEASRFLQQASFGATRAEIDNVVNRGIEGWIDWQMSLPVKTHMSYYNEVSIAEDDEWAQHVNAWWNRSLQADDQLRQRVAFALSQIWVISQNGVNADMRALSNYYDVLLRNAFGNYRDLMEDVTLNPLMGEYLSMLRNEKPNLEKNIRPDENYARELMQLFTIGLIELQINGNPVRDPQGRTIPTYDQEVIEGFAHVFTGWTWGNAQQFKWWSEDRDLIGPMKAFAEYHAEGEKKILNGVLIPAGQTPEKDLADALDNIFNHENLGPFVARALIQKLVTSNPSPQYIQRVANKFNNNGAGVRGDLRTVVKAILMDKEAQTGETSNNRMFGKLKEPIIRLAQLWRAFDAKAASGAYVYDFRWVGNDFAQAPLRAPSVFNFFSPFYAPQGTFKDNNWVSPEMQIHYEGTMAKMTNHMHWRSYSMNNLLRENPDPGEILIDINYEKDLAAEPQDLLDHLNLLLMANQMSDQLATATSELMASHRDDHPEMKAADAIALIVTSPEFSVQN